MPGLLWNEYLPYFANLLFLSEYPGGRTAPVLLSGFQKDTLCLSSRFFLHFIQKSPG